MMPTKEHMFKGREVPEHLRDMAYAICDRFGINGECDGMYIANVIARHNGIGDGCSHFTGDVGNAYTPELVNHLLYAYGENIIVTPDDKADLIAILEGRRWK